MRRTTRIAVLLSALLLPCAITSADEPVQAAVALGIDDGLNKHWQNKTFYRLFERVLEKGDIPEAASVAETLTDYRKSKALGQIAQLARHRGDEDLAGDFTARAERAAQLVVGNRKDIAAAIIATEKQLADPEALTTDVLDEYLESLKTPHAKVLGASIIAREILSPDEDNRKLADLILDDFAFDRTSKPYVGDMTNTLSIGIAQETAALDADDAASEPATERSEADAVAALIQRTLDICGRTQIFIPQTSLLLAECVIQAGIDPEFDVVFPDGSKKRDDIVKGAILQAGVVSPHLTYKGEYLARAMVMAHRDDRAELREKTMKWLDEAIALQTGYNLTRLISLGWGAAALDALGESDKADAYLERLYKDTADNPNKMNHRLAFVELCHAYDRFGIEPDEETLATMRDIIHSPAQ